MALSLRQIKSRIRSIESTRKLTRAMEMIAISKLRRTERALNPAQAYYTKIQSLLMDILPQGAGFNHPYFNAGQDKGRVALCVVTSDTGFCSAYNHSLLYVVENFLRSYDPAKVRLVAVGKKGFSYLRKKGFEVPHAFVGLHGRYSEDVSSGILQALCALFTSGEVSEVYVAYMQVQTLTRYKPAIEKILNIERVAHPDIDYSFEPGLDGILQELVPEYLASLMRSILLHAFTAEHRARSIAMGEATQNATELLEGLVLLRNKVRQANITREIIEVVSSAEALK